MPVLTLVLGQDYEAYLCCIQNDACPSRNRRFRPVLAEQGLCFLPSKQGLPNKACVYCLPNKACFYCLPNKACQTRLVVIAFQTRLVFIAFQARLAKQGFCLLPSKQGLGLLRSREEVCSIVSGDWRRAILDCLYLDLSSSSRQRTLRWHRGMSSMLNI